MRLAVTACPSLFPRKCFSEEDGAEESDREGSETEDGDSLGQGEVREGENAELHGDDVHRSADPKETADFGWAEWSVWGLVDV